MLIKNNNIIQYYENLKSSFSDNSKYHPAKVAFIVQKNITLLKEFIQDIYITRDKIVQHYGTPNRDGTFFIPEEVREQAQKELDDLLEIEQEVNILKLKFKDIEDLEFTSNQMEALMFMIDEEDQAE